jgi:hypothetical protein
VGIVSFLKKVFTGEAEDPELEAARARHNIVVGDKEKEKQEQREKEFKEYDPWTEVDNLRRNFFIGSWASRKFRIIGEDKVKAELEALRKKREEKERAKREEGE